MSEQLVQAVPVLVIVIPCRNEESTIERKLADCMRLTAEGWRIRVVVADDRSEDGTVRLAGRWVRRHPERIRLVANDGEPGKAGAVASALAGECAEVVAITDADVLVTTSDLLPALRLFADPEVGAVCVGQREADDHRPGGRVSHYERFRDLLRMVESRLDSVVVPHGQLLLVRSEAAVWPRPEVRADDIDMALRLRNRGWRVRFCPQVAYLEPAPSAAGSSASFVRRAEAAIRCFRRHREEFHCNPRYGLFGMVFFPGEQALYCQLPRAALAAIRVGELAGAALPGLLRPPARAGSARLWRLLPGRERRLLEWLTRAWVQAQRPEAEPAGRWEPQRQPVAAERTPGVRRRRAGLAAMAGPALSLWRRRLVRRPRAPISLIHFVTNRCDLNCPHCFVPAMRGAAAGRPELTTAEHLAIIERLGPEVANISITGGEPFLLPDLDLILRAYASRPSLRSLLVTTHGGHPERTVPMMTDLCRAHPAVAFALSISLDGEPRLHDRLRRAPGLFERAASCCRALVGQDLDNLTVQLCFTMQAGNWRCWRESLEYLDREFPEANLVLSWGREAGADTPERRAAYGQAADWLTSRAAAAGARPGVLESALAAKNAIARRQILAVMSGRNPRMGCVAGRHLGVIGSTGELWPCELRPGELLGNVRDCGYDLGKLWQSPEAAEVRRRIVSGSCRCTWECAWTAAIFLNWRFLPELGWRMAAQRRSSPDSQERT